MDEEKRQQFDELSDELGIILSVKDFVSQDEIQNLVNKFSLLSEYEIREKIKEITNNSVYIDGFSGEKHDIAEYTFENTETLKDHEVVENKAIEQIETVIIDKENIPEVSYVKTEVKYGQLSLEWGWPKGIKEAHLCYRMDKFPESPADSAAQHIMTEKQDGMDTGSYIINRVMEGNYYFIIYTSIECEGKTVFSNGQRRLIVNKLPEEVFYEIKTSKSIFGKLKSAQLCLYTTSEEINFPQVQLIGKLKNMPSKKSDGGSILSIDYQTLKKDEAIFFDIPIDKIKSNMYVKLFFEDDSNSKLYRIISPAKDKLYFK